MTWSSRGHGINGHRGGGSSASAKPKASPIPRPSASYKWKVEHREYGGDEKHRRDQLRQWHQEQRQASGQGQPMQTRLFDGLWDDAREDDRNSAASGPPSEPAYGVGEDPLAIADPWAASLNSCKARSRSEANRGDSARRGGSASRAHNDASRGESWTASASAGGGTNGWTEQGDANRKDADATSTGSTAQAWEARRGRWSGSGGASSSAAPAPGSTEVPRPCPSSATTAPSTRDSTSEALWAVSEAFNFLAAGSSVTDELLARRCIEVDAWAARAKMPLHVQGIDLSESVVTDAGLQILVDTLRRNSIATLSLRLGGNPQIWDPMALVDLLVDPVIGLKSARGLRALFLSPEGTTCECLWRIFEACGRFKPRPPLCLTLLSGDLGELVWVIAEAKSRGVRIEQVKAVDAEAQNGREVDVWLSYEGSLAPEEPAPWEDTVQEYREYQ
mmetsp:Transcript_41627/g.90739  ORF Transcript_41627/g.90739 Transcript_41627/m.90739 type:complete len:447 (-) Transcript_41627:85-1425(-)